MYEKRIESGAPLIPYEFQKYLSIKYLLNPKEFPIEDIAKHLINPATKSFYNDVGFTIFRALFHMDTSDSKIKSTFNTILKSRRIERSKVIFRQLGIAQRHLTHMESSEPVAYRELMKVIFDFEPETIPIWGWKYSVYWDFDRFIHIYLRHYNKFFIEGSSKGQGTNFQYKLKDIRRLINLILEKHKRRN